jgi:hypothetical protein
LFVLLLLLLSKCKNCGGAKGEHSTETSFRLLDDEGNSEAPSRYAPSAPILSLSLHCGADLDKTESGNCGNAALKKRLVDCPEGIIVRFSEFFIF